MSVEDLYVEIAQHKALLTKLTGRVQALENIVYKREPKFTGGPLIQREAVPEFDPKILTEHQWKGKKLGHRHWADGSLAWGWDFIGEFPDDVIAVLKKGSLTIGESVFTLSDKVVNTTKKVWNVTKK